MESRKEGGDLLLTYVYMMFPVFILYMVIVNCFKLVVTFVLSGVMVMKKIKCGDKKRVTGAQPIMVL